MLRAVSVDLRTDNWLHDLRSPPLRGPAFWVRGGVHAREERVGKIRQQTAARQITAIPEQLGKKTTAFQARVCMVSDWVCAA